MGVSTNTQILDGPSLAGIWLGNITNWNDTQLQALNPNSTMPDAPIRMSYFSGISYGTHATFVKALASFEYAASPTTKLRSNLATFNSELSSAMRGTDYIGPDCS
jgi:ABC-type phosphate transport system substrate-binding protein